MRGLSEENGSWKIICIWRRNGRKPFAIEFWRRRCLRPVFGTKSNFAAARRDRAQDATGRRGLAATQLADQGQRLAPCDGEADIIHCAHCAGVAAERRRRGSGNICAGCALPGRWRLLSCRYRNRHIRIQMAGRSVAFGNRHFGRKRLVAGSAHELRAAQVERASGRTRERMRDGTRDRRKPRPRHGQH